jgi:hypothetical protein
MQIFLDSWLYGVVKTTGELGNDRVFLRAVQEASIRQLLDRAGVTFDEVQAPLDILRAYDRHLDSLGIIDSTDVEYRAEDGRLCLAVGGSCPYRSACNWIHEEGTTPPCFLAVALSEVLRLAARRQYDGKLVRFGVPCQLTFNPMRTEASDDGS